MSTMSIVDGQVCSSGTIYWLMFQSTFGLWCLMPLSTLFQLYHGCYNQRWYSDRKQSYNEYIKKLKHV
jgi:hypothetical protein